MDLKTYIGLRVRAARRERGLTQEQLAEAIGKTVETVSNVERGQTLTGLDTLESIAGHLRVPIRDFFEDVEGARRSKAGRLETELQVHRTLKSLSDRDLDLAHDLVSLLVEYRRK